MADGYTRAVAGNIGVCIGTSGPAGTDMITGLYAAIANSVPILCITGQAPRAKLYKEDFQAIDIESIAKSVTKWAVTVREPGLVPRVFQQAFHVMRSGRPGPVLIDLPIDVQTAEIEFDIDTYEPCRSTSRPPAAPDREGALDAGRSRAAADRGRRRDHQRRRRRPPGPVRGSHRRAGDPDADGLGRHPRRPSADGRDGGLQTSHRYGNRTFLKSDFVLGIGNRSANRHTGTIDSYTPAAPSCMSTSSRPRSAGSSTPISASSRMRRRPWSCSSRWPGSGRPGKLKDWSGWAEECLHRKQHMLRKTHYDEVPLKPQRVYAEMNEAFGRDTCYVTTIGLSQIAGAQFLHVYSRETGSTAGGPAPGLDAARSLGRSCCRSQPRDRSTLGDYDFQFMVEELAVGAQHKLPYLHVVVNNSYLGLIRQAQRGLKTGLRGQPRLPEHQQRGGRQLRVDHVAVARPWAQGDPGQESPTSSRRPLPGHAS